jgi:hypothetical protein
MTWWFYGILNRQTLHDRTTLDFIYKPLRFKAAVPDSALAILFAEAVRLITGVRRR